MLHSEYFNGSKKAVVSKNNDLWEVSMYMDNRILQKTLVSSEEHAENIAEDFINAGSSISPTLLNEKLNG
jgi:ribosomal protein L21E